MSLPPNWTAMGLSPTVMMQRRLLRPRPRVCMWAPHVPESGAVDWTPCPLDLLPGATLARELWAAPPPSRELRRPAQIN